MHSVKWFLALTLAVAGMPALAAGAGEVKTGAHVAPAQRAPGSPSQQQIEAFEQQRSAAISKADGKALAELLADDYMHIHGTARVENKAEFIKAIVERPRTTTRGPLTIRVYGDMAVVTGEQVNSMVNADKTVTSTAYMATQVVRLVNGRWQLVSMQATQIPAK